MGIQNDLAKGREAEQLVIDLFIAHGYDADFAEHKANERYKWDVEVDDFTVEVKNDIYALKSGNIAVETFNTKSNKASGLTATEADYWIFVVGEEVWISRIDELKQFVEDEKPFKIVECGGDNNAYLLLYKKDHILNGEVFVRIDSMNKERLETWLSNQKS